MGRISDDDIQRVREATDLVAVVSERVGLRQKGRLWWGNCPFHAEKTPSFKVDPATQLWHCFGCGAGGDAFGFVMRSENLEFPEAVRLLADRARIEIVESGESMPRSRKERLVAACDEAAAFYHRLLRADRGEAAEKARSYLGERGFGSEVAGRWQLGYAPGHGMLAKHLRQAGYSADELIEANLALGGSGQLRDRFYERIMFPIRDLQGRTIAFGGRIVGKGEPKYLNTQDTPIFSKGRNLYAIDIAKAEITTSGQAIVVEGYTDVIAVHEAGMRNVVATLGTALTRDHVRLLGRFANKIVYLFDGDAAGLRAADRAVEFIDRTITPEAGREQVDLRVAVLPGGQDPADFVAENGADALAGVIAESVPLLEFAIDRRIGMHDLSRPEDRARALKEAAAVLAPIKDSTLAADYANYIADAMQAGAGKGLAIVDTEAVMRAMRAARVAAPSGTDVASSTSAVVAEISTPAMRAEREVVGLIALHPEARGRARDLLAEDLLTDATSRRLAEMLLESGSEPAERIVARLEPDDPEAARVLSATMMLDSNGDADDELGALVLRLKELDLERRIASGRARLKRAEGLQDAAAYDELFKQVAEMDRELHTLRRESRAR